MLSVKGGIAQRGNARKPEHPAAGYRLGVSIYRLASMIMVAIRSARVTRVRNGLTPKAQG